MKAAVVTDFAQPPHFQEYADPRIDPADPDAANQELVEVIATGLHPRVRSQASGVHYTSTEELALVPGIDGVGRREDGSLVYFVLADTTLGAMAELTVIDPRRSVALPADANAVALAGAINPAMSSWIALRRRIDFRPGQSVLILGATGSAGQLAVQIAKFLGAAEVIGAGRDPERLARLPELGATATVDLAAEQEVWTERLAEQAAEVDVVLDYLWAAPTEAAIPALLMVRSDRSKALDWVEIGAITGPHLSLASAYLRQANLRFLGSGQGAVSARGIVEALPELVTEIDAGRFVLNTASRPLSEVEAAWTAPGGTPTERIVFLPGVCW